MTTRVLVTGAAGLLGSQLLRQTPTNISLTATYLNRAPSVDFIGEMIQIDLGDACSVRRFFAERDFDLVINCAGASDVDRCETDHEYAEGTNLLPVQNLVEAAKRHAFRLITFSTDYVFDGLNGPYSEQDQPNPTCVYGQTKLLAERAVGRAEIRGTVLRVCSLCSSERNAPKNLLMTMRLMLILGKTYRAAEDLFSNPTDVADLACAVWQLVSLPQLPRILHVASPDHLSRYDLAIKIAKRIGADTRLVERVRLAQLDLPAERPQRAGLRSERAYELLGRKLKSLSDFA